MRVAIIGQGYVGLTIAVGAAGAGHSVVGFDINDGLVVQLNSGKSHIEGISDSALASFVSGGTYLASTDAAELNGADVIVIAVPTPLDADRNPDLSFVHAAANIIAENVKSPALIVNESAVGWMVGWLDGWLVGWLACWLGWLVGSVGQPSI